MTALEEYLEFLYRKLPIMCRTKDLLQVGLYRSEQAACAARRRGNCPDFIRTNARVVEYPRPAVLAYVKRRYIKGKKPPNLPQDQRSKVGQYGHSSPTPNLPKKGL